MTTKKHMLIVEGQKGRTLKNSCHYLRDRSQTKSLLFLDKSTRKSIVLMLNPPPLLKSLDYHHILDIYQVLSWEDSEV